MDTQIHPTKTFLQHLQATLKLGVPLVVTQLIFMLIGVTDTLMLGWLGVKELAAGTLAFQMIFMVFIFGLGFGAALTPLVAAAAGRDDTQSVRRTTRMGLWVLFITVMLFMIPLSFAEAILHALGQNPELIKLATAYLIIAKWSLIPAFLHAGLRSFLTSLEHTKAVLWSALAMAVINAILNYALIFGNFGAPRLEMEGAAIATVIANILPLIALGLYIHFGETARPYAIFQRFWRPEWPAFRSIVKIGLPIAISIFFEAGMFAAAALMIGWIGVVPLAAHGIALQWASLSFMIPLGFAMAGTIRVGNAAGRKDFVSIGPAGWAAMVVGLCFSAAAALVFWLMPEPLIRMFLDNGNKDAAAVLAYAVPLFAMAAAFQIFDSLQVASGSNLRGLQDTKIPMIIATISYWPIGMGMAYLLAFPLGYGGAGVWAGLVIGLAVAGVALTYRFVHRERLGLLLDNKI
ncbi:MAG: MATE family efflux transporter [Rhizobiaceae bacterium]